MNKTRPTISACAIWFILCALLFSNAGSNILLILAVPMAGLWGIIWFFRWMHYLHIQQFGTDQQKARKKPKYYWIVEPATLVLSLALSMSGAFSFIRFLASENALTSYSDSVRAGKVNLAFEFQHPPRRVGLYTVTITELLPDGTVRMITSSHSVLDRAGFANSPNNPPATQGEDLYKHIHGQWWYWYQSW